MKQLLLGLHPFRIQRRCWRRSHGPRTRLIFALQLMQIRPGGRAAVVGAPSRCAYGGDAYWRISRSVEEFCGHRSPVDECGKCADSRSKCEPGDRGASGRNPKRGVEASSQASARRKADRVPAASAELADHHSRSGWPAARLRDEEFGQRKEGKPFPNYRVKTKKAKGSSFWGLAKGKGTYRRGGLDAVREYDSLRRERSRDG